VTDKPTVHEALAAVMGDVQAVRKADRNSQQGYAFRGIDAVVNAVGPVLRKHGVIITPTNVEAHYRDVTTSTGKPSRECTVLVTYRVYGPAGDFIEAMAPGESMDFGDKGAPKAMSVAMRIVLLQALCIPTDEPDPDSQSYERAPRAEESQEPSEADKVRAQIGNLCRAKKYDADRVEAHFTERMKVSPPQASFAQLVEYRDWLQNNPLPEPAGASA
jgi:hypothetical protein